MPKKHAFEIGNHVAAFWADDFGQYQWHLAIVENMSLETVQLSYLKRMDSAGRDWVFPEEAEIQQTSMEQILDVQVAVAVRYYCSTRICCRVNNEIVNNLNLKMENAVKSV